MKTLFRVIFCLLLAVIVATAAIAEEEYSYIRFGDYGFPLQQLFSAIGYSDVKYTENEEAIFDEQVLEYLESYQMEAGLSISGVFDCETMRRALNVDGYSSELEIVWIPMHGGKKYHGNQDCSSMYEPRQIPLKCAEVLGFDFCKRCYKKPPPAAG